MALPSMTFPERPLQVSPPGTTRIPAVGSLVWTLLLLVALALWLLQPIADLREDFSIADTARPVQGAQLDGGCQTRFGVLVRCTLTLNAASRSGPGVRRDTEFFFIDFNGGEYPATVVADPVRPGLPSTDLALEQRWNRFYTLLMTIPLGLGLLFAALRLVGQRLGGRRTAIDSLSGHVLHPVLLRMEHYQPGRWTVAALPPTRDRRPRTWPVPRTARPIVMDPQRRLVLGVAAGSEELAMPLDTGLTWLGLERSERLRLREQLGPERLGGWLPALQHAEAAEIATAADTAPAHRVHHLLPGLVLLLLAALAAWMASGGYDFSGQAIVLQRGNEGPASGTVRLHGIRHGELAVRTLRIDARAAHPEHWQPLTAPGWQPDQPVDWLLSEAEPGALVPRAATVYGNITGPVPDRAREELARLRIELAANARVLEVQPYDPLWRLPALIVAGVCAMLGSGLLLRTVLGGLRRRHIASP